jgi:hypothetical protein
MATIAPPDPIVLGLDRWELTAEGLVISHGLGPWKKTTIVPLEAIRTVDHVAADMTGAPRWVSDKEPGQITVHTASDTYTMCANHTGQFAEALRAAVAPEQGRSG